MNRDSQRCISTVITLLAVAGLTGNAWTSDAIVGHWRFNEGLGTNTADESGYGHNGLLCNMLPATNWVPGIGKTALRFNGPGSSNYVDCGNAGILNLRDNNAFTIACWIRPNSLTNDQAVLGKYLSGGYTTAPYQWKFWAAGQMGMYIGGGGTNWGVIYIPATNFVVGEWRHVVATYDGHMLRGYVNGQEKMSKSYSITLVSNAVSLNIGRLSFGGAYFNGDIDNVIMCNYALWPGDIYALYEGNVGCWQMKEGIGTTTADDSAFTNHATLVNMDASAWIDGRLTPDGYFRSALHFGGPGASNYLDCGNDSILNLNGENAFTISCWIRPNSLTNNNQAVLGKYLSGGYTTAPYQWKYWADGRMGMYIGGGGTNWGVIYIPATNFVVGEWRHVAATYDGHVLRGYVNGQEKLSKSYSMTLVSNAVSLNIGRLSYGGAYFNGDIGNVRLYDRAMTPAELYRNYIGGNLCGYWSFDEGSGAVAADKSGRMRNDGVLVDMDAANSWGPGRIGAALTLDGINDHVNCGNDASLNGIYELCVSAWVKPDTRAGYHVIAAKGECEYFLATHSGKPYFAIGRADGSGWNVSIEGANVLDSNCWVYLAGTYNMTNGTGRLYVNGVLDSAVTGTAENIGANTADLMLGAYSSYSEDYFFQGALDEVRIYDRALGPDEIHQQWQNEGGEYGFGCEGNPTGNPIGGGAGYSDVVTTYTYYVNNTVDELIQGLAMATTGDVVYVNDAAALDLSGYEWIVIPGGVTLASGRGVDGSSGALLYTTVPSTCPLFKAGGANVRVTGLRLQGSYSGEAIPTNGYDISMGIRCNASELEVDNCEISAWPYTGIAVYGTNAYIHHNYIHHCLQTGYGYGVMLGGAVSESVIEANIFDYNRHSIASSGGTNSNYEACFNLVLEHCNVYCGSSSHSFDVHRWTGTDYAGGTTYIHHNTFKTPWAVNLRGIPYTGAWICNNWLYYSSAAHTIRQEDYPDGGTWGNMDVYINIFTTNRILEVETSTNVIYTTW